MFGLFKKKKKQNDNTSKNENKPQFDLDSFQAVINDTFPGIAIFVRGTDISDQCMSNYVPGKIIRELGFTDASFRVGGIKTTHRFTILSNHMGNLSSFEHGTNWGLCVAKSGSRFKILDVYRFRDKTQIILLHLPDDERWKMFINAETTIEKELIETCRKRFETGYSQDLIPELATDNWLARCKAPLGMDINGHLFPLE